MNEGAQDLVLFFGRFHPLLAHLPIGGIILAGMLELVARFPRFKDVAQSNRLIIGVAALSSVIAVVLGLLLSQSGDYDPQLVRWHRLTGITLAVACVATWIAHYLNKRWIYVPLLLTTIALLGLASHFGGSITHGRDFLTRYAPSPFRALARKQVPPPAAAHIAAQDSNGEHVFELLVQPILQQRCVICHGPEKQKAGLRVDSYEALLKGGDSGPALVIGKAAESRLIQRVLLPPDDDDHMPPQGKAQPTPAEILLLQLWIDNGTSKTGVSNTLAVKL